MKTRQGFTKKKKNRGLHGETRSFSLRIRFPSVILIKTGGLLHVDLYKGLLSVSKILRQGNLGWFDRLLYQNKWGERNNKHLRVCYFRSLGLCPKLHAGKKASVFMERGGAALQKLCHGSELFDTLKTAALPRI
jgi:hypothetical protein